MKDHVTSVGKNRKTCVECQKNFHGLIKVKDMDEVDTTEAESSTNLPVEKDHKVHQFVHRG